MDKEELVKKAFSAAIAYAKKQIKVDKENRYSLLKEWELPTIKCGGICPAFNYENEHLRIIKTGEDTISVTVKPYESTPENDVCDGCSMSPDIRGCLEGAIFHDPWYLALEDMSGVTGIPQSSLRELGDAIFGNVIKASRGDGIVARIYYWGVRVFGGLYHTGKKHGVTVIVIIAMSAVAGCSGCAIPDVFDGEPSEPDYQKVAVTD